MKYEKCVSFFEYFGISLNVAIFISIPISALKQNIENKDVFNNFNVPLKMCVKQCNIRFPFNDLKYPLRNWKAQLGVLEITKLLS